jgi:hypothetical protein
MQKTYLILAHKNPQQLKRLIDRLNDDKSFFYIHIDKKSDIENFEKIITDRNVKFLTNRINSLWGDISQIYATMNLIEAALNDGCEGMIIQLTGQDYPVKSNDFINQYLENNADINFIDTVPVEEIWQNYKERTESYKFNISEERGNVRTCRKISKSSLKSFCRGEISLANLLLLLKKRHLPLRQYGGSAWWAMNVETLKIFYDYVKTNEKILFGYFKYTHCPDENFFATIIKAIQNQDNSIKILPSFTFVDWNRDEYAASPPIFTINDLAQLNSLPDNWLFARKFDTDVDEKILDELDKKAIHNQ